MENNGQACLHGLIISEHSHTTSSVPVRILEGHMLLSPFSLLHVIIGDSMLQTITIVAPITTE